MADICPLFNGTGELKPDSEYNPGNEEKQCHGCDGRGVVMENTGRVIHLTIKATISQPVSQPLPYQSIIPTADDIDDIDSSTWPPNGSSWEVTCKEPAINTGNVTGNPEEGVSYSAINYTPGIEIDLEDRDIGELQDEIIAELEELKVHLT